MLQYNLRALFVMTVLVALATWVMFVLPEEIGNSILIMAFVVTASALVAGAVYLRGYRQAFSIGSLVSHALASIALLSGRLWFVDVPRSEVEFRIFLLLCMTLVMAGGAAAVGIRYWAVQQATERSPPLGRPIVDSRERPVAAAAPSTPAGHDA